MSRPIFIRVFIVIFGFVALSFQLQASTKILLRPKARAISALAYSRGSLPNENLQRIEFNSEASKKAFVDNLSPDFEYENVVDLRGDDVIIQQPVVPAGYDPLMQNQWSIYPETSLTYYGAVDIDAVRAWTITTGSEDVVVYVMDSGVDKNDPDLQGRVTSGYNAFNPSQPPIDENGHGTHVASIISAKGGNAYGISGVVPGNIQIGDARFLNAQNQGDSESAIHAVQWIESDMQARRAQNPNVKFIGSNSWGGDLKSDYLEQAMQRLAAYDFLPITSAGNHSRNNDQVGYYPCRFNLNANICVAASNDSDLITSFSGWGPSSVHLLAPGNEIFAIIPGHFSGQNWISDYGTKSGTSQAVPHVSGVAALIWAANPNLSAQDVRNVLLSSVDRLPGAENQVLSGGRLNAYRAVLVATGQEPSQADRYASNSAGGKGGCSLEANNNSENISWPWILGLILILVIRISVFRNSGHRSSE